MKRTLLVLFVLLCGFALPAADGATTIAVAMPDTLPTAMPAGAGEATAVKDGYALLDALLTLFDNLTLEKKETVDKKATLSGLALVDSRLSQLGVDVKASLEAGLIDKIFFYRYRRLLMHYKLIIMPVVRGDLLKELFEQAFDDFTWNVTYEHWAWGDKDGIAKMAAAVEEEFVQLMIYLDTKQKRDELRKKIGKRILPPPPPPPAAKKKAEEKKPE